MKVVRSIMPGLVVVLAATVVPAPVDAQRIFHSTQSANLQTTETLRRGNLLFEISHRFLPTFKQGGEHLWGLDGPIWNRLGLSYAVTGNRVLIGVQRTNMDDNLELNLKAVLLEMGPDPMRVDVGVMGGIAWNTDPISDLVDDNATQMYAQLLVDALLGERLAVGVVPTYLRNPRILDAEPENAFVIGVHAQAYLMSSMSLLGEWIFSEERPGLEHDSGTFGIELETRGHFFKILVTNQTRLNPTQFLGGTPYPFEGDQLRLGFNITRVLPF
jgi:hypothetical protein